MCGARTVRTPQIAFAKGGVGGQCILTSQDVVRAQGAPSLHACAEGCGAYGQLREQFTRVVRNFALVGAVWGELIPAAGTDAVAQELERDVAAHRFISNRD